jgi:hypothetical protein
LRESKRSKVDNKSDNNGVTPAKGPTEVANVTTGKFHLNPALPLSLISSSARFSKSKVIKKHAIHLIRFCLKSGISENNNIIQFLKENEVILPGRTFDRYKSSAEKELESDLDADIWLSNKVQNALVSDYKDIFDRIDKQLVLDDLLMQDMIRQAIDKAMNFDGNPDKYYKYLDFSEMMKIQAVSNFTMKNKLDLISRGFMVYKIRQHIEHLREQINQKENKIASTEREADISSRLSFLPKSNPTSPLQEGSNNNNNESENEEYDQDYLDRNDLSIGINGQPIKKYLAYIEKKLGKPLSTL